MIAIVLGSLVVGYLTASLEVARRMQCVNNLKQLGLALSNMQDYERNIPAGAKAVLSGNNDYKRVSGFFYLLPYIEHVTLKMEAEEDAYNGDFNSSNPKQKYLSEKISAFVCPSDRASAVAPISYRLCYGDFPVHMSNMTGETIGELGEGEADICNVKRGVFVNQENRRLSEIKDGLSNTIAFSEKRICSNPNDVGEGIATTGSQLPAAYLNTVFDTTDPAIKPVEGTLALANKTKYVKGAAPFADSGKRRMDGALVYTGFATILPPNAPSSMATSDDCAGGLITVSSYHARGVNAAMADCSVRFISDNIDCGQSNSLVREGGSLHGGWGAMGTADGHETEDFCSPRVSEKDEEVELTLETGEASDNESEDATLPDKPDFE